jgi:hypothetical protein
MMMIFNPAATTSFHHAQHGVDTYIHTHKAGRIVYIEVKDNEKFAPVKDGPGESALTWNLG